MNLHAGFFAIDCIGLFVAALLAVGLLAAHPRSVAARIDADRRLANSLFRESDFYAAQSESSTRLITLVGTTAGVIMALGAIFGALNSLYASVSARTREIAILRALGFSGAPVVASVLTELLALSLLGGVLGAALGWLAAARQSVVEGLRTVA